MESDRLVKKALNDAFDAIPKQVVTTYDWDSPEADRFWNLVDALEDSEGMKRIGVTIDVVGEWVGLRNIRQRRTMLRKRERLVERAHHDGQGDATVLRAERQD